MTTPPDVPLIRAAIFDPYPELLFGFSTRAGGFSAPPFASLNLSLSVGDDPATVARNRQAFADACGVASLDDVAIPRQVHSTRVAEVVSGGSAGEVDGLVTNRPGVYLAISAADCVPVFLYDPVRRAVAGCHAGWRGAAGDIAGATVQKMTERYGTAPGDVRAYIGPSICQTCFEVGEEVAEAFDPARVDRSVGPKPHVDLPGANAAALRRAGVVAIEQSGRCTVCERDVFFSHRGDHGQSGRLMGLIGLRPS